MRNILVLIFSVFAIVAATNHHSALAESKASDGVKAEKPAAPMEMWAKRCQDIKDKDNKVAGKYCEIFQRLDYRAKDSKELQRVTEFAVGYPPGEKLARAVIILPLGVMVKDNLSLLTDGKDENHFHVQYCLPDGCYATLNLPENILSNISKANKLLISGKVMNGQDLKITLDLTGFSKALAAIKP